MTFSLPERESGASSSFRSTRDLTRTAARSLLAEGKVPTVRSILDRIGQGSATTISSELKAFWQEEMATKMAIPPALSGLPDAVVNAAVAMYDAALKEAENALGSQRKQMLEAIDEANAERQKSDQEKTAVEQARCLVEQRLCDVNSELARVRTELTEERQRTQDAISEKMQESVRLAELRQELSATRTAHAQQLEGLQESLRGVEKHALVQIDEARQAQKQAEDREKRAASVMDNELALLRQQLMQKSADLANALGRIKEMAGRITRLESQQVTGMSIPTRRITKRSVARPSSTKR